MLWDLIRENVGLFLLRFAVLCLPKHTPLGRAVVKVFLNLPSLEQSEREMIIKEAEELIPWADEYIRNLKAKERQEREGK